MKLVLLLCLALLLSCTSSHMPTVYEFCSHVVANGDGGPPTCDASQCQGRPGKIGPLGPRGSPGLKGMKGEQGTSEGFEEKVNNLEDSLESLTSLIKASEPIRGDLCYIGMKTRQIPDSAISASSNANNYHAAHLGRLDNGISGGYVGAWCTGQNRVGEWIQVDFGETKLVAGLITQGRPVRRNQWVTSYKVSCGDSLGRLEVVAENGVEKIFRGNSDMETKVVNKSPKPVACRYIRVYPQTYHTHMCMRLEFIQGGCYDLY